VLEVPVAEGMLEFFDVQASSWKVAYIAQNSVGDLQSSQIEVQLQDVLELWLVGNLPNVLEFVDFPLNSSSSYSICVAENGKDRTLRSGNFDGTGNFYSIPVFFAIFP
jgi:hypothetical protein